MSVSKKESPNKTQQAVVMTDMEKKRLLRILNQTDKEKLQSFMDMLRSNVKLQQANITHK